MRKQRFIAPTLHDAMDELVSDKGINVASLSEAIEEAVAEAFRKHYQTEMPVKTKLKPNGHFSVLAAKTVVETVADPFTEIAQSNPLASRYGLGDAVFIEVTSADLGADREITDEFGRMAALLAKQIIRQRVREAERRLVYESFKGREGELIHGKVQRVRNGNLIVELGPVEAILPRRELPIREKYREGDRIKAVIMEVRLGPKGPQIVLSRAHPWLVQRLFEMEITEVFDKTVEIKAIAREAGFRTKIAVTSRDPNVDPVGACVGQKGIRVQTVVKELGGEKIDIVHWDAEPTIFIRNALSPAECERVVIDESHRLASVVVPEDHLSLAIGKEGQNARLAARLTNWRIDIKGTGELAKADVEELLKTTFGATPAEILASLGVGAETAPVLEAAGFAGIESIAGSNAEALVPFVGAGAQALVETARARWMEIQEQLARSAEESRRKRKKSKVATRSIEEVGPFTLPDGRSALSVAELVAMLDELPGDEIEPLLQSEGLKNWLQNIGTKPTEIANLMARYR
jgi:N utilization substance protein A